MLIYHNNIKIIALERKKETRTIIRMDIYERQSIISKSNTIKLFSGISGSEEVKVGNYIFSKVLIIIVR